MTDFDPDVATGTKRTQEQVQPTDVAFVESGGWEFPICYCCRKKCDKYGWRRCPTSSQKVKDETAKLVRAGHVMDSDNASTATAPLKKAVKKKGMTFAVVEEESENKDLPTFEDYLRREGMISINVQNDTLGLTGDGVAEYGVGCVEINFVSTPPLPSDDADKWKVQGRSGSKLDNINLLSFKGTTPPPAASHVPGQAVIIKSAKPAYINSLVKKDNPKIKISR